MKAVKEVRERYGFALIGYVVMPEHVHLLMSEPRKGTPSDALKALKQGVSRKVRGRRRRARVAANQLKLPFREGPGNLPQFWQRRFYDFNVWSAKKVREKLEYMHRNPVTRGLVGHPREWRWSSWSFYYRDAACLLEMDRMG